MFQAIQYVTGTVTLAAFLLAVVAFVYRSHLRSRARIIENTKKATQVDALKILKQYILIDTAGWTRDQQFRMAMTQTRVAERRFYLVWLSATIIFLASASLVAAGQWYRVEHNEGAQGGDPYTVKESILALDLRGRTENADPEKPSRVTLARSERIRRNLPDAGPFVIESGTNGLGVEHRHRSHPTSSRTRESKQKPTQEMIRSELKHQYFTEITEKAFPVNELVTVRNDHIFQNAFQGKETEWYGTRVKYPTNTIVFVLRFSQNKPCKSASIYKTIGNSDPERMEDETPFLSDDGLVLLWSTTEAKPGEGYAAQWTW